MASRIIQRGVEKNFTAVLLQDRIGSDIVGPLELSESLFIVGIIILHAQNIIVS